jgi:uncharacterized membrane protein YczE
MHHPPALRGGLTVRLVSLVFGLFLCACGVVCLLEARLGLAPWDVLHQGLAKHTPLSFGAASIVVGLAVLTIAWLLGARIGVGTVANALLIGLYIQLLTSSGWVARLQTGTLAERIGLFGLGVALFGAGTAFYLGAAMGAGPRDSLMLVVARRTGVRIGFARAAIELTALAVGFALGGKVGLGTLGFALLIGVSVEASLWLLDRSPLSITAGELPLPDPAEA